MRHYRRTVRTPWEVADVWDYLSDFCAINEWDPRATNTRSLGGEGEVGTSYETDVRFLGRTSTMTYTVTRLERPHRIEWTGHNGVVRAHDVITVGREGPVTSIDYVSSYAYTRLPWVLDRVMAWPINRLCDDAQQGLGAALA